ncbi:hypothetical protein JHK82_043882 [Glycine max]|nr:hypothetical protein JHK82_043882 [Glycine max]KAG5117840.1 hypothetical protein JHK84_043953 [Glycine max]
MHTNPPKPTDCGNSKQYIYLHQYGENSIIIGRLNYDTIGFGSTGMEQSGVTFPKSIFGCVFYSNFRFKISTKAYGIVDLGSGPLSLASQLGAGQTSGNIINDSVPILTHLEQGIYTDFISSVKEAIDVEVAEDAPTPFEYCVRNPTNMNFPEFVLHFTGADVVLNPNNMFIALDNNLVCMAVDPPKEFPSLEIGHRLIFEWSMTLER